MTIRLDNIPREHILYLRKLRADRNKWKADCLKARKELRTVKGHFGSLSKMYTLVFRWARKHGYVVKDPFAI